MRPGFVPLALLLALAAGRLEGDPGKATVERLLASAHAQVGVTVHYDGRYQKLAFPGGDVPLSRGVCTDVLIRAYRDLGFDLQVLVHEDMKRAFGVYPRAWGLTRPDPNIDHRRVPNLATFFGRHGRKLPVTTRPQDYAAGDIVTWRLDSGLPHIGLVSDRREGKGPLRGERPLIVHNIGAGTQVEDVLLDYRITGHYRFPPDLLARNFFAGGSDAAPVFASSRALTSFFGAIAR